MNFKISGITKKSSAVLITLFLLNCSELGAMLRAQKCSQKEARSGLGDVFVQCHEAEASGGLCLGFNFFGVVRKSIMMEVRADKFITEGYLQPGEVLIIACPRARLIRCRAFSIRDDGGDVRIIGECLIDPNLCREKMMQICAQYNKYNVLHVLDGAGLPQR